jgi:hypothetical protein
MNDELADVESPMNDSQLITIEDAAQMIQDMDYRVKIRLSALNLADKYANDVDSLVSGAKKIEEYLIEGNDILEK